MTIKYGDRRRIANNDCTYYLSLRTTKTSDNTEVVEIFRDLVSPVIHLQMLYLLNKMKEGND